VIEITRFLGGKLVELFGCLNVLGISSDNIDLTIAMEGNQEAIWNNNGINVVSKNFRWDDINAVGPCEFI
jgi:hypothetical protein